MTKWMPLCAAIIATSALAGCVTTEKGVVDSSCQSFAIIHPSRSDTFDTKRQVLAHNQTYRALCEPKK